MNIKELQKNFPDLSFDGLTYSRIPRIRIIFSRKNFKGLQKDLKIFLQNIFNTDDQIYTLNQLYATKRNGGRLVKRYLTELDNLGLGNIYNHNDLLEEEIDGIVIYSRVIPISYEQLVKLAIIDAWGRMLRYGEKHGLPHLEMDNIIFTKSVNFLVHINDISLNNPDIHGIDISSYDKVLLRKFADNFHQVGFTVWVDKIDEFNV